MVGLVSNIGVTIVCLWFLRLPNKEIVRLYGRIRSSCCNQQGMLQAVTTYSISIRHTRTSQQWCFRGNELRAHHPRVERPLPRERYKHYQLIFIASGRAHSIALSFHTSREATERKRTTADNMSPPPPPPLSHAHTHAYTHTHTHTQLELNRRTHNPVSLGDAHVSEGSCYGGHLLPQFWIGDITCILTLT